MLLTQKAFRTHLTADQRALIAAHYRLTAPLLAQFFFGTPFVYSTYPDGLGGRVMRHGALQSERPHGVPTCKVPGPRGTRYYLAFGEAALRWTFAHAPAVELHGWGCTQADPERARFARILLERNACHRARVVLGATMLGILLREASLQAVPVLEGTGDVALWVPLSGEPRCTEVRAWLRDFCAGAVALNPAAFSLEATAPDRDRINLRVGSTVSENHSALPYSLHGDRELHVCTPVLWSELPASAGDLYTARTFARRLAIVGDLFRAQVDAIGNQMLPN